MNVWFLVKESCCVSIVTQVEAEDADDGVNGRIKYSIDFGNKDGFFSINETTGDIALEKKIPLEENRILEFSLSVTARDGRSEHHLSSLSGDQPLN